MSDSGTIVFFGFQVPVMLSVMGIARRYTDGAIEFEFRQLFEPRHHPA